MTPLLELDGIRKHYPVHEGLILRRQVGALSPKA